MGVSSLTLQSHSQYYLHTLTLIVSGSNNDSYTKKIGIYILHWFFITNKSQGEAYSKFNSTNQQDRTYYTSNH